MSQPLINHPNNDLASSLPPDTYASMYQLFVHICKFWNNLDNPEQHQSRLNTFMDNRIRLRPEYRQYYKLARKTMDELISELGEDAAYKKLFTDKEANQPHTNTPLAVTRQKVSNEFITFQINQGGFKVFGAKNSQGYISGAYIPGEPAPYRTGVNNES